MTEDGIVRIVAAGDSALVAEFPSRIDQAINDRVNALADALRRHWSAVLLDIVVGYCTVTVYFDPLRVDARWLEDEIRELATFEADAREEMPRTVDVPVCYDPDLAPDLPAVAAFANCAIEDVVRLHSGTAYRVYMIGFMPGFAYLASVDPRIAMPRRVTPRVVVPAGSVGIAGLQTGIYPRTSPGGWNIVGRTPLEMYNPERQEPCLVRPGDTVRFVPITRDEFEQAS